MWHVSHVWRHVSKNLGIWIILEPKLETFIICQNVYSNAIKVHGTIRYSHLLYIKWVFKWVWHVSRVWRHVSKNLDIWRILEPKLETLLIYQNLFSNAIKVHGTIRYSHLLYIKWVFKWEWHVSRVWHHVSKNLGIWIILEPKLETFIICQNVYSNAIKVHGTIIYSHLLYIKWVFK